MSTYRRGRTWWIEFTSNGQRIRESAGTSDRKAAAEYEARRKAEVWRQARLGEAPPVSWGEAVARWLKLKPRSKQDRYTIRMLEIPPRTVLPLDGRMLEGKLERGAASSFNRYLNVVVAIHHASGVEPPEVQRRKEPPGRTRWLTAEEWQRLRKALREESQLLEQAARLTVATGLRENNVLELRWEQVDLKRRTAWVHGDQAKAKAPIGVPLSDEAVEVLLERRGLHRDWVFGNPDAPLTRASNRAWYAARRRAKLAGTGVTWHTLRHTWASWHVMNGTRLEVLQDLGGWKTLAMVRRYAHLATTHLAAVAGNARPISLRYNKRR